MALPWQPLQRVAIVGAGMAGAACARVLVDAGLLVQVFDKSRGVGGRLATRRVDHTGDDGVRRMVRFDHGAPAFSARGPEFLRFVEQAARDGLLRRWQPKLAPAGHAPLETPTLWVPAPDMPALCRALLTGVPLRTECRIDALRRTVGGWRLDSEGAAVAEGFDAVVVAIPAPQAALLLDPHEPDWARRAVALPMLPDWTLLGLTDDLPAAADRDDDWSLGWPASGALASVVRNDARPGRQRVPGLAQWVVHATAAWSQMHIDWPDSEVQLVLQQELAAWLGRPLHWRYVAVHRWRYASVPRATPTADRCGWDGAAAIGVCGDALGGAGVEGAWSSGRALADKLIDHGRGSQASDRPVSSSLARTTRSE